MKSSNVTSIKYLGLGSACAGVRTRGGLNSSRFVGCRLTSSVKQLLEDNRHYIRGVYYSHKLSFLEHRVFYK